MSGFNASPPKRPNENQKPASSEKTRNSGRTQRPESRDRSRPVGHSRHIPRMDRSANESFDTTAGSSMSSVRSDRSRNRGHRSPTQKTMLSKALAKANTAVLLDNAQNFEGAVDAYTEACELLRQVMLRSSDDEDKTKLSTIRSTYWSRITELREIEDVAPPVNTEKALPRRPGSIDRQDSFSGAYYDDEPPPVINEPPTERQDAAFPPRRQSLMPSVFMNLSQTSLDRRETDDEELGDTGHEHESQEREPPVKLGLQPPRSRYAPPPLSPRRPPSPSSQSQNLKAPSKPALNEPPVSPGHARDASQESTSWLDTIDESASSASSSRLSSLDFRPGIGRNLIDEIEAEFDAVVSAAVEAEIEAEFDAALNAAVEAAYHEESRPGTTDPGLRKAQNGTPETVHRDSTTLDSPVIPAQEEVFSKARTIEPPMLGTSHDLDQDSNANSQFYDDEADEEERLLEEMTQGYGFGDFHFDKQSKSALPRQSDSSGFSGRTWPSSNGSTTATNATSLSTLAEIMEAPSIDQKSLPPPPPPAGALPAPPVPTSEPPPPPPVAVPIAQSGGGRINRSMSTSTEPGRPSFDKTSGPGVRDRRLSGQNAKQLKIETYSRSRRSSVSQPATKIQIGPAPIIEAPPATEPLPVKGELDLEPLVGPPSLNTLVIHPLTPNASIHSASSLHSDSPATPALTQGESQISVDDTIPMPASPGRLVDASKARLGPSGIRKNMSQSSLRMRNLSVATIENTDSPITPGSATFPQELRKPSGHAFTLSGAPIGGMYLFDDHIGTPNTPRTPRTPNINSNIPAPLESCPDSFMLRPFWLMRCLYQTIAHPRGGYITTNLFIPRDIWRVKNVKLKAVEDKIAQNDLLSAALLRLANVDQLDAEVVLEEMQAFEAVLESVRVVLQKKLGSDVGLPGAASMFKGVPMSPDEGNDTQMPKAGSAAKFASGWRKLRSKSSAAQLNTYAPVPQKEGPKGPGMSFTIPTLPMTSSAGFPSSRTQQARRNPASLNLSAMGANANYMASLARLFDAAQILDSIARQVEDPGLKSISQTHVGLELCVRNASEFFAFFVVRWVVADVGNLIDKFVKRGGEWVMS
jgi:MIT (microtubule interacting and transport) domain